MQVPPVKEHEVFQQPDRLAPATHLWRIFSLVKLTQNIRRQRGTTFIDILNTSKVGKITSQHLDVLLKNVSKGTRSQFIR